MRTAFFSLVDRYRRVLVVGLHIALIVLSNYFAFWLRFDGQIPNTEFGLLLDMLPWLIAIRAISFLPFRLYEGLWRYASIWDLRNIVAGVATSSAVFFVFAHSILGLTRYPRSVFLIDALLLVCFMGGARLGRRIYRELAHVDRDKRVLIYGAGDAGEMIVRDMKNNAYYDYEPIGFVDDDPRKTGARIHGVAVLGTRMALPSIIEAHRPHEVLVAMPSAGAATIREVVRALEPYKVAIKTLPGLPDVMDGRLLVSQIRNLKIEDLLARAPVGLDTAPLSRLIKGKRVLVTGAGGSIGSELCRQIAQLEPETLTLYERYENGLFAVANDLATRNLRCTVQSLVGDITDRNRLDTVMDACRPAIIFHAAAHKHVPLMEGNPCEAVKNNVIGTRTVMEVAASHGVERFILISSDKAVNPSSVMGTTKRVAELLVQAMNRQGRTAFLAVRFGNVLASNGSVVLTFMEQIKAGGPVTVTHPDMRRYFMLISEAVQLVLNAAALAEAGAVYVLEMGDQVKLVDMARNLIRLSGFVPDEEIPIVFTGLRPGEKLFEEIAGDDERAEPSGLEKVLRVRPLASRSFDAITVQIDKLERLATDGDVPGTLRQLGQIVPAFQRVAAPATSVAP
ncbi:MAG: polysaccharide biosynthesis protein [Acidobacteriia bacterium]|nr:polysaccharide biosynthesis protein [Terriglobia bacterium]